MEIKASQVKELRELSGVGMMECKKALVEVEGDIEKALELLRSNSALKAEKKSARVAADGIIKVHVSENYATMVEINSETDFAARMIVSLSLQRILKKDLSARNILM